MHIAVNRYDVFSTVKQNLFGMDSFSFPSSFSIVNWLFQFLIYALNFSIQYITIFIFLKCVIIVEFHTGFPLQIRIFHRVKNPQMQFR